MDRLPIVQSMNIYESRESVCFADPPTGNSADQLLCILAKQRRAANSFHTAYKITNKVQNHSFTLVAQVLYKQISELYVINLSGLCGDQRTCGFIFHTCTVKKPSKNVISSFCI